MSNQQNQNQNQGQNQKSQKDADYRTSERDDASKKAAPQYNERDEEKNAANRKSESDWGNKSH